MPPPSVLDAAILPPSTCHGLISLLIMRPVFLEQLFKVDVDRGRRIRLQCPAHLSEGLGVPVFCYYSTAISRNKNFEAPQIPIICGKLDAGIGGKAAENQFFRM